MQSGSGDPPATPSHSPEPGRTYGHAYSPPRNLHRAGAALAWFRCIVLVRLCLLSLAVLGAVAPAAATAAAPPLPTVLQDDAQLLHRPADQVRATLARLRAFGVDRVRVTANWSVLTRDAGAAARPAGFDAADPAAYEQARWRELDQVVRLATEEGVGVMIDVAFWAPRWASADPEGERGRTEVNPDDFAAFSAAIARRYSGGFVVPADPTPVAPNEDALALEDLFGDATPGSEPSPLPPPDDPLPRVDVYTLWNEPNHTGFLRPQWVREGRGHRARSAELYRAMVARAYPAVKAVAPGATVLVGATSSSGAYRNKGTAGVPPLRFLRELACVDDRLRPLRTPACAGFEAVPGDGWSHHPYSMKGTPAARNSRFRPDDLPISELPRLARTLDRLADAGRVAPGLRGIWLTEYGYETNPPSTLSHFAPDDQARFLPWGEFLAWRVPQVRSFAQFLLRDLPPGTERTGTSLRRPFGEWFSGLEFADGRPKPATDAFRAGLFPQRLRGARLRLWGRLRLGSGARKVVVEVRRGRSWRTLRTSGPRGGRTAPAVHLDGRGLLDRRARAPRGRDVRYRLTISDGAGVVVTAPVPAARALDRAPRR